MDNAITIPPRYVQAFLPPPKSVKIEISPRWQFMEAWNSLHFMKLREAHLNKDVRDTQCERCIAYG